MKPDPRTPAQRDALVQFFEHAVRPDPATHLIGTELEKFGVAPNDDGVSQGARCGIDGASVPGGTCKDPRDCSAGATCMTAPGGQSLCIRPCNEDTPNCDCRELPGNPWAICMEDTVRALPPDGG